MALTTKAELEAAVRNWLDRADLAARIPEFIDLADTRIRAEQEWDRRIYTIVNGGPAFSVTSQGQELPQGVRTVRTLWPTTGTYIGPLRQVSLDELRTLANSNLDATGVPSHYSVIPPRNPDTTGDRARLYLWPRSSETSFLVDFEYVRDVGKLGSPANALFLFAPGLYLFGALAESAPFLKHDDRVPVWEQRYGRLLRDVNRRAELDQFSASNLRPRIKAIG